MTESPSTQARLPEHSKYDAFISYSHNVDSYVAATIQGTLQSFGKAFYKRRARRIFRDTTNLSASPQLWPDIQAAIRDSSRFILLASQSAAAEQPGWVSREIHEWLALSRPPECLLIVQTDGEIVWNRQANDFDWGLTTALPRALRGCFKDEPLHVDLRWARADDALSRRHPSLIDAVATLVSSMSGIPKDELVGEDIRQHRRFRIVAWIVSVLLLVATVSAGAAAIYARKEQREAQAQGIEARTQRDAANIQRDEARRQKQEAQRQRAVAVAKADESQRRLYAANIQLTKQALENNNLDLATRLLAEGYNPEGAELRGFEWRYLWRQIDRAKATFANPDLNGQVRFAGSNRLIVLEETRIRVLDSRGKSLFTRPAVRAGSHPLAVTSNGRRVAFSVPVSRSPDDPPFGRVSRSRVEVLDVLSGESLASFEEPFESIGGLEFTADGRRLFVASGELFGGGVGVWDLSSKRLINTLPVHMAPPPRMAVSPDGKLLAALNQYGLEFWDVEKAELLVDLTRGEKPRSDTSSKESTESSDEVDPAAKTDEQIFESLAFTPDGSLLAVGYFEGNIKLIDTKTRTVVAEMDGHRDSQNASSFPTVNDLAFSPDGTMLLSASSDHTIKMWDLKKRSLITTMQGHRSEVVSVSVSADGKTIGTASVDGTIKLWKFADQRDSYELPQYTNGDAVTFSRDGLYIAMLLSNSQKIKIWNAQDLAPVRAFEASPSLLNSISYSPVSDAMVVGTLDCNVELWNMKTGRRTARFSTLRGYSSFLRCDIRSVAISPDGKSVAGVSFDGVLKVWDAASGAERLIVRDRAWDVVFSPDGRYIAIAWSSGAVELRPTANLNLITRTFKPEEGEERYTWSVAFSTDGGLLAVSRLDETTAHVFAVSTGGEVATLRGHVGGVRSISFSPDGRTIATGSNDGTVKLWATSTFQELLTLNVGKQPVDFVLFSPAGNTLATISDSQVRLWPASARLPSPPPQRRPDDAAPLRSPRERG